MGEKETKKMKYAEDKDDETTDTDRYIIRVSEEEAENERLDLIDLAYRICGF